MKKYMLVTAAVAAAACSLYAQPGPESGKAAPEVKVEKIVTAAGVESREPAGGGTAAFAYGTQKVYTWTSVTAESTPVRIRHAYFFEGKKVREIELEVKASPYRLWSWKNVWPGNWKVVVFSEDGEELADTEFTVSGEETAR